MPNSIRRLLLCLAMALPLAGGAGLAQAHDDDREEREIREPREDRDLDRRERRSGRDEERSENSGRRERDDDRRGRSDDEDRSGRSENSGKGSSNDNRGRNDDRGGEGNSNSGRRNGAIDVERGPRGGDRERSEVLLIGPANAADTVRGAGYDVVSEQRLETLQRSLLRVRVRDSETIEQAVDNLRQRMPDVRAAPNHVFTPMGAAPARVDGMLMRNPAPVAGGARIGIIDTGADTTLAALNDVVRNTRGFAPGGYTARPHGSAVAQLAAAQGASLAIGDVFGVDDQQRLVAPADAITAAIDWLLAEKVRVINISIEGPRNDVLEFVIEEAVARGTAIVAAMGNGGPSAPPGYPAAYPGVIAVTALDENGVIYRRAARGSHVQFAARGSYSGTQAPVLSSEPLSGTSFAAPLVAAELERRWREKPGQSREEIVAGMRASAVDLGDAGWDPIYGWGRVDVPGFSASTR